MTQPLPKPWRDWRALELLLIYFLIPLGLMLSGHPRLLLPGLWLGTIYAVCVMKRDGGFRFREEWKAREITPSMLGKVAFYFVLAGVAMSLLAWFLQPERFFAFPLERPQRWAMVMILYPVLSVVPQELLFRTFFFRRYQRLVPGRHGIVLLSAAAFGLAHIVLGNPVAVFLSTIGGWIFARTYQRHRSLALVSLEHALYGCLLFTCGLGTYFFSGARR